MQNDRVAVREEKRARLTVASGPLGLSPASATVGETPPNLRLHRIVEDPSTPPLSPDQRLRPSATEVWLGRAGVCGSGLTKRGRRHPCGPQTSLRRQSFLGRFGLDGEAELRQRVVNTFEQ